MHVYSVTVINMTHVKALQARQSSQPGVIWAYYTGVSSLTDALMSLASALHSSKTKKIDTTTYGHWTTRLGYY